jgi:hypothetical protein
MPQRCPGGLHGTATSPRLAVGPASQNARNPACTIIIGQIQSLHYIADHWT